MKAKEPLVVPIAHYVGQDYDLDSDTPTFNLRGGWGIAKLSEAERLVWAVAHGIPRELNDGRRWTRDAVANAVTPHLGESSTQAIITDLLSRDILAEVSPGTPQAIEFASTYRLIPLQIGLGNTKEAPWDWRIGIGNTVLVTTTSTVYRTWEWGHLYRSLWDSCRKLAKIRSERTDPPAKPEDSDPEAILTEVLESLHPLLASNCAYFDILVEWGSP